MLLKSHLGIKCHSKFINLIRLLLPSSAVTGVAVCVTGRLTVSLLLAFNLILQRSHHSLTLQRSLFGDSATVTNSQGRHNCHQSGVIGITDQLILQNGKKSDVYRRNNNRPETLPCVTPDTTLTSLLWQLSTWTADKLNLYLFIQSIVFMSYFYNLLQTSIMRAEFERLSLRQPMDTLSMKRYELPPPPPGKMTDVAAWSECVDNSFAQLEHQATRSVRRGWRMHPNF